MDNNLGQELKSSHSIIFRRQMPPPSVLFVFPEVVIELVDAAGVEAGNDIWYDIVRGAVSQKSEAARKITAAGSVQESAVGV